MRLPRSKKDLEAFFAHCADLTAIDAKKALPLVVQAPGHVERCASVLGDAYANFRVRSLALLASALGRSDGEVVASEVFKWCRRVRGASGAELAGVDVREALFEAEKESWETSLELVNKAVDVLEGSEACRDDCSLPFALAARGHIHGLGFRNGGVGCDISTATKDFRECLRLADEKMVRTRRAAVSGLCVTSVLMWLAGLPTPPAMSPSRVVEAMIDFRRRLRAEGTPWRSLTDAKARWILALALYRLLGHLGDYATRHLTFARDVLTEVGTAQDVREITLDYQWCLLADGRFAAALSECDVLEAYGESPGVVSGMALLWRDALAKRRLTPRVTEQVYAALRDIPGVRSPLPPEDVGPRRRIGMVGRRLNDPDPIGF